MKINKWLLSLLLTCSLSSSLTAQIEEMSTDYESEVDNLVMEESLNSIYSAWSGHRSFAEWLVGYMKPNQVVDLGVDYGFSTFVLANSAQKNGKGIVTGIDFFKGEEMTGFRNTYDSVMNVIDKTFLRNLEIIVGEFSEVGKTWNRSIDILHIDGYHSYEAVSKDFNTWSPFVPDNGIILFHDINVPNPAFEVINLFRELKDGHKLYFLHSCGLGIYTKNTALYEKIKSEFNDVCDFSTTPL